MRPLSLLPLTTLSALLLVTTACQKSEKAEKNQVQKVENTNAAQPAAPAPIPVPTIAPGTWVGNAADESDAIAITIIPGNRITILQQGAPTNGSYTIDPSTNPATFNFTPDDSQGQAYSSQIQWIDENTVTMTSLVPAGTPAVAPVQPPAPAAQPAAPQPAPFTGNVAPPASYTAATATPVQVTAPATPDVIVTITFHRQQPVATPAAPAVSP